MFESVWFDFGISVALTTLRSAIKNPEKKEELRKVFLKVFRTILLTYPEFADEVVATVAGPYPEIDPR
jgi:hypothetical protein